MPEPQGGFIGFKEVAFKGPMKAAFVGLPVAVVAVVVACILLFSMAPATYKGTSAGGGPDITVSEYSQELRLTISYTFHLIPGDRGGWKTDDGINDTSFTFQLEDKNGDIAGRGGGNFRMPTFFEDEDGDTSDDSATHTESETYSLAVPKGNYHLNISAATILDISIVQKSTLDQPIAASLWLALLLLVLLSGAIITVMSRRDHENLRRLQEACPYMFPSLNKPATPAVSTGQYSAVPAPSGYAQQPVAGGGYQKPGPASSLEYVPGNYVVENYCMSCRQLMWSQMVDGVIICEHCGAQNRV